MAQKTVAGPKVQKLPWSVSDVEALYETWQQIGGTHLLFVSSKCSNYPSVAPVVPGQDARAIQSRFEQNDFEVLFGLDLVIPLAEQLARLREKYSFA